MKALCLSILLTLSINTTFAKTTYTLLVGLSPAGSFEATGTDFKGKIKKSGDGLSAKSIRIPVKELKTGIELRDDHLHKRLMDDKNKYIKIKKAAGKGGKGSATMDVKGKEVPFNFSYVEKGGEVEISFPISIKKFGISGINYMGVGVEDIVKIKATLPISK